MTHSHDPEARTLNEQALQRLLLQASARETEQVLWAYRAYIADLLRQGEEYAQHLRFLIRCFEGVYRECEVMAGSLQWRLGNKLINLAKKVMRRPQTESANLVKLTALGGRFRDWKAVYAAQSEDAFTLECHRYVAQGVDDGVTGEAVEAVGRLAHTAARYAGVLEQRRLDIVQLCGLMEDVLIQVDGLRSNMRFTLGYWITCQVDKLRSLTPSSAGFLARLQAQRQAFMTWKKVYAENLGREQVCLPAPPAPLLEVMERIESDAEGAAGASEALQMWREEAGLRYRAHQIQVIQATPPMPRNPYYTLLPQHLQGQGFHVSLTDDWDHIEALLRAHDPGKTIVHLHQLDVFYHDPAGSEEVTRARADALLARLRTWKKAGVVLVWTKHNPYPHVDRFRAVDEKVTAAVATLADRVVVLGQAGVAFMERTMDTKKISVLPHPSFEGVYGPPVPRAVARKRLGLPEETFLFGHVGELRAYKGLERLLEAVTALRAEGADVGAVIVGQPGPPAYVAALEAAAGAADRVHAQEVAAGDMACWLGALDVAVFPFTAIWGSSSVVLAVSYGVPVVAPDTGMLPEYVQEGDTGFLYDPEAAGALLATMQEAMACPWGAHLRYMSDRFNEGHAASRIAQQLAECYLNSVAERR